MSSDKPDSILLDLVKLFASRDGKGNWWGHDTDLGNMNIEIAQARQQIIEWALGIVGRELKDLSRSFENSADKDYTGQQVHQVIKARLNNEKL